MQTISPQSGYYCYYIYFLLLHIRLISVTLFGARRVKCSHIHSLIKLVEITKPVDFLFN